MPTPPIIIKKKITHAGHHGGAWKVAYADFVTAMMALFIVLWLLNTNKPVREAVAGYFKDPPARPPRSAPTRSVPPRASLSKKRT
jgi:chemotaxis protein MotB